MLAEILEETIEWRFLEAIYGTDKAALKREIEALKEEHEIRRPGVRFYIRYKD